MTERETKSPPSDTPGTRKVEGTMGQVFGVVRPVSNVDDTARLQPAESATRASAGTARALY